DSPALSVAAQMGLQGATVVVTDPKALPNARRVWPDLRYAETAQEAARGADVVVLATEWDEYRTLDPHEFGRVMEHRRIVDGRGGLDLPRPRAAVGPGRPVGRSTGRRAVDGAARGR
ncbi:MAG TPA: UDP binding domain-containing protein, partial [Actinotalea sp.]|nr:UDP binding domain-containing protein [Actinotalea sp.]